MYSLSRLRGIFSTLVVCLSIFSSASASDWPAYRKDAHRSAVTDEDLKFPLRPSWVYVSAQAPRPAWPEPVKNLNRTDFDYAPHPVVAEGIVCFGSSADDTVRALDQKTGREKWHFITGGPVRFAPQIADGRVYFASDDGVVYCLDAATGKPVWTFRGSPEEERMIGNGRMISRWPVRTGVLVLDGVVYFVSGMWPSEGIFAYALRAGTGKVIWCNDTSGARLTIVPHMVSTVSGVTPQGALLATDDILLVPMGRSAPATYDLKTGKLLHYAPGLLNGVGGTCITIDADKCYLYAKSFYSNLGIACLSLPMLEHATRPPQRVPQNSHFFRTLQYSLYEGKVSIIVHNGELSARLAYGLARAGKTLIIGKDGVVSAEDTETKKDIWRSEVRGKAWEIAVADGCVFVSTDLGEITCFVSAAEAGREKVMIHKPTPRGASPQRTADVDEAMLERIRDAGMDAGLALVLGDADGRLSRTLANHTRLHVINVLHDAAAVTSLREELLATTALYGSRIHVQLAADPGCLPFAQYPANAVVVAREVPGLSGRELYRLLRPCGGILLLPGLDRAGAEALIGEAEIPAGKIRGSEGPLYFVRGRLPGAWDWDSGSSGDKLVKAPLRPIWFGGPGPARILNRKFRVQTLAAANGRFFINGDNCLVAVDAYNGVELWSRPMPYQAKGGAAYLNADADSVYYTMGKTYFRGKSMGCIQMDARTGQQRKIYAPFIPSTKISLKTPLTWPLKMNEVDSGAVTLQKDADGLILRLVSRRPESGKQNDWDVFLDFRPQAERYGLYGRGTYHFRVLPARDEKTPASWRPGRGTAHPRLTITGTCDARDAVTTVRLSWDDIKILKGKRPISFGFGVTLTSREMNLRVPSIPMLPISRSHLFCDEFADGINNGWAAVILDDAGTDPDVRPSVIAGKFESLPEERWKPKRQRMDNSVGAALRIHPLSGQKVQKLWIKGFACSGYNLSATSVLTRSGNLAMYDFADDSGLRSFGGIRPSCGNSTLGALGVWYVSDGGAGCECTYSFQTGLALAPAERRLNEDWALFYDWDTDTVVRQAALNMGAPGDRRDENGTLWLGFPRPETEKSLPKIPGSFTWKPISGVWQQAVPMAIQVPLIVEVQEGFGAYRVNADRVVVEGTDRPWIYASGYRGIRKATMKLRFMTPIVSRTSDQPTTLDGRLDEPVYDGKPQAVLSFTKAQVFLFHDAENLYVAARCRPAIDRKGNVRPWKKSTSGEDARIYNDDSLEVFISDAGNKKVIHLGVSASGARLDALTEGNKRENLRWKGRWRSAVSADEDGLGVEIAVPWTVLAGVGLAKETLVVNVQVGGGHHKIGEAIVRLGPRGRTRCENFVPVALDAQPVIKPRLFTARLHFAELDDVNAGRRVFDIKLQGKTVLEKFDIAKEAGVRRAIVREFKHVQADDALILEFIPSGGSRAADAVPVISGIELFDEEFHENAR